MLTFYIWVAERAEHKKVHPAGIHRRKPKAFELIDRGNAELGIQPTVSVHGKIFQICNKSLFVFGLDGWTRRCVMSLVGWVWFDRIILFLIALNSIGLALVDWRSDANTGFNGFYNNVLDLGLTIFFTLEGILKVVAWGFFWDRNSYLRDAWNWLDFIVILTAWATYLPGGGADSLGFFRVFRALRPLRSLNAVPQMKVLVNTVISSVPRLGNVSAVGAFLFLVFGIVGVTLMSGVFNRLCHTAQNPVLVFQNGTGTQCWSWPYADDDRLCGGAYNCEASGGFCGGLEEDQREELRPHFGANGRMNLPWCAGSEPKKLTPDSEYMNFDNMLWALLVVFQCMTMEGWTDIMYRVQDAYDFVAATVYFFLLIPLTSFFLLNVALAVVDEARADFDEEEASEEEESNEKDGETLRKSLLGEDDEDPDEQPPWLDCSLVHTCRAIAFSEWFMNIIMLFIVSNVITMMMESFPPPGAPQQDIVGSLELTFLVVFCVEMAVLLTALGPHKYFSNPVTAFDGVIVITSVVQMCVGQAGPFTALRTLRLFRVLNKLANRWPSFKVLLKAMVLTAISLNYWLILFALVLYICTLMVQTFFATEFHFNDPDSFDYVTNPGEFWCPGTENEKEAAYRQDCIPRANFDTFLWALVTIFQIMTGENWNTVMYAGMRAAGPGFCLLFVLLILFGQTLFLSLFLSMLMSKFDHVQDSLNQQEDLRREHTAQRLRKKSLESCSIEFPESPKPASSRVLHSAKSMAESLSSFKRSLTERDTWPVGYAWFIFSKTNPVRKLCHWILHAQVEVGGCKILWVKTPKIRLVFDNFILLCILVSTVTMAMDSPLADPKEPLTIFLRGADEVFAIIFIGEMVIKLLALGLIWGEDAYLKSSWNWLDGVVVMVSIINMASSSSTGFLKTLRILRAFRPLRVISRNENLKVVVQTIFASMPHLLTLVIVAMLFLLIFALFGLSYLNGTFLMCDLATEPGLAKQLGQDFTTPLCFPPAIDQVTVSGGLTHGQFQPSTTSWAGNTTACPGSHYVEYQRITADTPICIGRCLPEGYSTFTQPEWLCPKALTMTEELPAACGPEVTRNISAAEQRGIAYVDQMTRSLVLPCGGSTVNSTGHMVLTAHGMSCADLFCGEVDEEVKTQCRATCSQAPYFCVDACGPGLEGSAQCESCKYECEAQCRCPEFCEGLIRDAALCLEQGSRWVPTISQNFNNIWFAMLTLFEISTTEGWVDVMYSAADSVQPYVQPKRDNQETLWVPFFMLYLFFSNMFIINLSVGVIVDKFMSMKQSNTAVMLTEPQKNWVNSIMSLYSRRQIVNLMDLHEKPWLRRKCYELVSSEFFETSIMGAIVINTLFLAAKITPTPFPEWETFLETVNYIFAGIFTVECVLKIFALRTNYWGDRWNCFDFTCVVATIVGIVVSRASNVDGSLVRGTEQRQRSSVSEIFEHFGTSASCLVDLWTPSTGKLPRDLALAVADEAPADEGGFMTKVFAAAAQGCTAALVAAILSAMCEPLVNRLLVKRMTVAQAYSEVTFSLVANFFLTTFPTNMLKFPVFEVINRAMMYTSLSPGVSGLISGWLFCTIMLPVTNYRFRKSMGWEIKASLLYQAYIPTVARDIIYGWARGLAGPRIQDALAPTTFTHKAMVFGLTIWASCIISSPCNEWRGYTLQPPDKKLPFNIYFKPINYARSTGIGSTIMGVALCFGMLVTPYAEEAFAYMKEHTAIAMAIVAVLIIVVVRIDPIIQVIRIFRIARLFRLLRFLKGLNKIFMALLMSLPKLMNVLLILLLLLILYSILGVSLFSTTKLGETLNVHANFQNFILAFITLFRASTGEAWNEIMHELAMTEVELYKQGEWCSPVELFDTEAKFEVLKDKCLIEHPNSCAQSPYFSFCFWVTYTLLITFMVMNLVIAVILEGYEDGKESPASEVVDVCVKLWLKHDPDHRLSLPLGEALSFINKALREVDGHHSYASASKGDRPGSSGSGSGLHVLQSLPMKYVAALDVQVGENGRVHFISACKQVMRFVCLGDDLASLEDLDTVEEHMDKKQREKLRRLIEKSELRIHSKIAKDGLAEGLSFATSKGKEGKGLGAGKVPMKDLKQEVAALKLQTAFKGILRGKSNGSLDKDKAKAKEAKDADAAPSTSPAAKPPIVPSAVMASSNPITIAAELTAALGAARRMGWVPVLGEMTADAVADLNDAAQAANLLLEGTAAGMSGAGILENIPEVGEESDDDVVLGGPLVATGMAGRSASAAASPKAAAPTPIAPTPPTPSAAGTRIAPVAATPPDQLAPLPMATPTAISTASSPVAADFFIGAATKAKAKALLAARLAAMEAESALASGATTPTAQPKHQGSAATNIPPTALTVDPSREQPGDGHIHPDLGIAASVTVPAAAPQQPMQTAVPIKAAPAMLRQQAATVPRKAAPPQIRQAAPAGPEAALPFKAAPAPPIASPATQAAEMPVKEPLDEAALARIRAAAKHTSFPPVGQRPANASQRRSSVPTEAMRAERRRREASAHERRQFEAYDPRRWGGQAPWTAEEAGDISAEYFDYKRRMERAGASAEETPVPANLRRFAYTSLQELREIEANGAVPRPPTPRCGEDRPETDYPFLR
ncbi:Cacna1s, partial [Symbiodinium sp. CCMP2456]